MTWAMALLQEPIVERLGWTLVHFLWQGAAAAAMLGGVLVALRRSSPNARYVAACAAMLLMAAAPVITFLRVDAAPQQIATADPPASPAPAPEGKSAPSPIPIGPAEVPQGSAWPQDSTIRAPTDSVEHSGRRPEDTVKAAGLGLAGRLRAVFPHVVAAWLAGVLLLSVRLLVGWVQAQRIGHVRTRPLGGDWQQRLAVLASRLGVRRRVRAVESALGRVPAVIGHLRPVLLLPACAMTGLTVRQLEAILAHELAHIRRCDYLVNLVHSAIETLLFYHPGVWWVSRRIRQERENCCDDVAAAACTDPLLYARALANMEQVRQFPPQPAVAASGGSLLARIRRLVGRPDRDARRPGPWVAGAFTLLVGLAIVVGAGLSHAIGKSPSAPATGPSSEEPGPAGLEPLWENLAAEDAVKGYQTVRAMVRYGDRAATFLAGRVRPVPPIDPKRITALIAGLDDDKHAVRQQATEDLFLLHKAAEPALRRALAGEPSAEAKARIETLLQACEAYVPATPDLRRIQRAVRVLELTPGDRARELLKNLAQGAPGAYVTQEAHEALERLAQSAKDLTWRGKVIDAAGGPVDGAEVEVVAVSVQYGPKGATATRMGSRVTTGDDGTFALSVDASHANRGATYLIAAKPGLARDWENWYLRDRRDTECVLQLHKPAELGGVVVDKAGKPIPGATVCAILKDSQSTSSKHIVGAAGLSWLATTTDDRGRFTFHQIPPGVGAEFIASAPGHPNVCTQDPRFGHGRYQYAPGRTDVRITLPDEARIEGRVVDARTREGVGGVQVIARWRSEWGYSTPTATAVSAPDGAIRLAGLESGIYVVRPLVPETGTAPWVAKYVNVVTQAGKTSSGLTIEVTRGGIVEVVVRDALRGAPIGDAEVELKGAGSWVQGRTDRDGVARVRVVPGQYRIGYVRARGYVTAPR
ncbi:MAG TPA: M56 family metallopeptidase, partial [Phycisphaerae bacterium]|nr:M56 family metallopeptidase [Phycisphaerae bacterium]